MTPNDTILEAPTHDAIDKKLIAAGWVVQDKKRLNLHEALGVAVREMDTGTSTRPLECVMFMRGVTRTQFRKSLTKPEGNLKGKRYCA